MRRVDEEYARLKVLFENVDESKAKLVDELLLNAAFLKVQLDDLKQKVKTYGAVETSNKGNRRESIFFKTYLASLSTYQGIIKTLNSILGKDAIDGDDEFDEFLRSVNG